MKLYLVEVKMMEGEPLLLAVVARSRTKAISFAMKQASANRPDLEVQGAVVRAHLGEGPGGGARGL